MTHQNFTFALLSFATKSTFGSKLCYFAAKNFVGKKHSLILILFSTKTFGYESLIEKRDVWLPNVFGS